MRRRRHRRRDRHRRTRRARRRERTAAHAPAPATTAAGPHWKKCATEDYPTLQCASLKVPLDHARPRGRQITLALSRVPHTAKTYRAPCW
ncbi:hypothetical protein SVIOM342S_02982 [Streptomyces violaceorubidus]